MKNTHCRRSERAVATYPATPASERTPSFSSNDIKTWLFFTFGFVFGASVNNLCAVRHLAMSQNDIMGPVVRVQPAATAEVGNNNGWRTIKVFVGESDLLATKAKNDQTRFSQCNQDTMVLALLGDKRRGYFIDLGANHAIRNSNTFVLERHFGWSGICIEPNPMYWNGLTYRDCHVAAAVVGIRRMEPVDFLMDDKHHGRRSGIISSASNKTETKHEPEAVEFQKSVKRKYTVPLLEILQQAGAPTDIDYLSITGSQEMALVAFPFSTYKINILTVQRPTRSLNDLLHINNFHYMGNLSCTTTLRKPDTDTSVHDDDDDAGGETLWIHKSLVPRLNMKALKKRNIF